MTHTIKILSVNGFGEIEWSEVLESKTKSGARRKANNVIRSCGYDPKVFKIDKRFIDDNYEYWTI